MDVPDLGVRVRIAQAEKKERGALAVYDLGFEGDTISVLAVGFGETAEKAFGEAAFQWATGVFTVIRHWLHPAGHTCFVADEYMVVRDDSGRTFAWRVHLGPAISRVFGADRDLTNPGADPHDVFRTLLDFIPAYATPGTVFWIEAYVVRYEDGSVESTCRLRNDKWPEGEDALTLWAATWTLPEGVMLSVRQFLLFEPIEPNEVPKRSAARPWWKRLFGGPLWSAAASAAAFESGG